MEEAGRMWGWPVKSLLSERFFPFLIHIETINILNVINKFAIRVKCLFKINGR